VLIPKLGERRAVLVGMAFNFVGFVGFALVTRGWMMIPILIVWCLSGIAGPATQSLMSGQYGSDEQGAVQGALTSLQSLMGIVGPVIATWVFGYFTSPSAPVQAPGSPFLLGAALIVLSLLLARSALPKQPVAEAA
jgi:DHA1 family tetracycline resistance protein-like MFS transporter